MRDKLDHADRALAKIAVRQHGVVSVAQMRRVGLGKDAVRRRVQAGRLFVLYRGVYAVGYPGQSRGTRWMAAVFAYGDRAVLSHGSAAALWGLLTALDGPVDVTTPSRSGRVARRGIRLHRCKSLGPGEVTKRHGIPVTAPARTLADLSKTVPPWRWRRAVRQAEVSGLALGPGFVTDRTRSDLERKFLQLCRRYRLPAPEVNVEIGRWTVDFLWPHAALAVEADSYRYHRGTIAFENDHARDLDLRQRGYDVRRFTDRQILERPAEVARDLREALCRAS
jgi:very-short-patch-repair endonuclease